VCISSKFEENCITVNTKGIERILKKIKKGEKTQKMAKKAKWT